MLIWKAIIKYIFCYSATVEEVIDWWKDYIFNDWLMKMKDVFDPCDYFLPLWRLVNSLLLMLFGIVTQSYRKDVNQIYDLF